MTSKTGTTVTVAQSLTTAFDYFNKELFSDELPEVFITLNRKDGTYGYFSRNRFTARNAAELTPLVIRKTGITLDEIALNPDTFDRSDKEILSTLVHEMAHHWQYHYGKTPNKTPGYHNGEWVTKMQRLGLQPISATTDIRGTGKNVSHTIVNDALFDRLADRFLAENKDFDLKYASKQAYKEPRKKHTKHIFRYECPTCNEWARAPKDASIVCGKCIEPMVNMEWLTWI